jgi:hypothetical protein
VDLSPQQARAIAASGYVFLIPPVTSYAAMYAEAVDPSSPAFGGGFARWVHHWATTSHESDVSESHATSLYSTTWLDVRGEPWVFPVPSIGISSTTRVTDLWGYVVDEWSGHDVDVGPLVIAADDWVGAMPPEARGIARGESPFVRCELRAQLHEPVDLARVRGIQRTYRVEALSAWSGRPVPPAAPLIAWWPCPPETLTSMYFWPLASFALSLTIPAPDDRGVLDRLAEIGIVPGGRWDASAFQPDVVRAIEEGMDEALTELMRAADGSCDPTPPGSRDDADQDYFGRALAALRSNQLVGPGPRDPTSFV